MRVFVVGAKSQALLSYHILARAGHSVPYVFDSDPTVPKPPWDCVIVHDEDDLDDYARRCDGFLICIANIGRGEVRLRYARRLEALGILPISAIHPTTFIAETARVGRKGFKRFLEPSSGSSPPSETIRLLALTRQSTMSAAWEMDVMLWGERLLPATLR